MMRRDYLISIILLAAACGAPSPAKLDAAIDDCRTRAKAAAGDYGAAYQVCLVDQHHFAPELAKRLGTAETNRQWSSLGETAEDRWGRFGIYAGYLRLARFNGIDSQWIERTIRRDSLVWREVDSIMAK